MRGRLPARWSWTVLGLWAAILLVVGSILLARHVIALPRPDRSSIAAHALARLRRPADRGRWLAVHVLYAGCRCSARVVDHLVQAPTLPDVREVVLWVGHDPDSRARLVAAGYRTLQVAPDELRDRYTIEAAPMLAVLDPDDRARYLGGYTSRKQGPDVQDRRILTALMAGQQPEENPVLGCAVSSSLQNALNPVGLP